MKYLIILCLPIITSCNIVPENPENNIEEEKPFLKKYISLNEVNRVSFESPIIKGEKLICFIADRETGESWITAYDKESLETLWIWNDAFQTYGSGAKGFGMASYIFDGVLCTTQSNISYGIDTETGETLWHFRDENRGGYAEITGLDDQIFKVTWDEWTNDASISTASIYTGNWEKLISISKTDSFNVRFYPPTLFNWNGEKYLSYTMQKWGFTPYEEFNRINLFSLTNDRIIWTSDTIPTNASNGLGSPGSISFHDGQLLLGNKALYSYNVEDGSLEWWKYYGNTFAALRNLPSAQNGKLYANNESRFLVGVDVHTGSEYFNVESGGICSKAQFYDGKLFETSYGDIKLLGFDADTGEKLYDIVAPFYERNNENRELRFENVLTIDPETGLAYTSDSKHLLVYEFD